MLNKILLIISLFFFLVVSWDCSYVNELEVSHPAYSYILKVEGENVLAITSFSTLDVLTHGDLFVVPKIDEHVLKGTFPSASIIDTASSKSLRWPNNMLQCGKTLCGVDGIFIGEGFLVPSEQTGNVYFVKGDTLSELSNTGAYPLLEEKSRYFYHNIQIFDLFDDGNPVMITARVKIDILDRSGKGEMVVFKGPFFNEKGKNFTMAQELLSFEGPDVAFDIINNQKKSNNNNDSTIILIVAPQFFSKELVVYSSSEWSQGKYDKEVIDKGQAFDAHWVDLNGNGEMDILATVQSMGGGDGYLYGYENLGGTPPKFKRHTISGPYSVSGSTKGTPGLLTLLPEQEHKKPSFIMGGDDGSNFYLFEPTENDFEFNRITLKETNGTASQPIVHQVNGETFLFLNDYSNNQIYLFKCEK